MSIGRRERIMIACVTFETTAVTTPIEYYDPTRIHLIHYVKDPANPKCRVYAEFYNEVCRIVKETSPKTSIIEHNEKVYEFTAMLRTVLKIIEEERMRSEDCDICVNISSGPSEYSAAAAIASMMNRDIVAFTVKTKEYTVNKYEDIKALYYINDKPVGLTKMIYSPKTIPKYSIEMPNEHLVRALRVLNDRNMNKLPVDARSVIYALKGRDLWFRDPMEKQSEAVHYQRDYVNKWLAEGWVEKNELSKKYKVSERGITILNTFYTETRRQSTGPIEK